MDGAPPTAATMAKISEAAFIPRPLTAKRLSKTSPMRDLTRNPTKIDPKIEEELITRERAWWRERGGGLKLTRPRAPRPEHYTAPAMRKAEPAQVKNETALYPSLKTKRSKGKRWKDLVQMMSLTTFVSRKFAEIDSVHRVPAPDLRWAEDSTNKSRRRRPQLHHGEEGEIADFSSWFQTSKFKFLRGN